MVKFKGKMMGDKVESIFAKYLFCLDYFLSLSQNNTITNGKGILSIVWGYIRTQKSRSVHFFEMCK